MKHYIILIVALWAAFAADAQVPGYEGRRLSLIIDACPSIAYNPNAESFGDVVKGLPDYVVVSPTLTVDYVLNQNTSLKVRVSRHGHEALRSVSPFVNYTFEVGFRNYRHLAPLGTYYGGGLLCNYMAQEEPADLKNIRFGAALEVGRNYILYDYLIFHIGIRYGITLANPLGLIQNGGGNQREADAAVWADNLMLFEIGLGVLPF